MVTRMVLFAGAHAEPHLAKSYDVSIYEGWARAIVDDRARPYAEIPIEYPPGMVPFVALPRLGANEGDPYRDRFIVMMLVVDAAAFAGLALTALRLGSVAGLWAWVSATLLLGPTIYLRLDLVPAAATVWAIERAAARAWGTSGAALAFGALSKLYPLLLLPAALVASPKRLRTALGFVAAAALFWLPHLGVSSDVWTSVAGYHSDRGIQVESSWGTGLLVATRSGYDAVPNYTFGAMHVESNASATLKTIALVVSVGAVAAAIAWLLRRMPRGDAPSLAQAGFGTLAVAMAAGTVLSPQFVVWLIALSAAALCGGSDRRRWALWLVLPIAALTQAIFPYLSEGFLAAETGPLALAITRNLLVLVAGVGALWTVGPARRLLEDHRA